MLCHNLKIVQTKAPEAACTCQRPHTATCRWTHCSCTVHCTSATTNAGVGGADGWNPSVNTHQAGEARHNTSDAESQGLQHLPGRHQEGCREIPVSPSCCSGAPPAQLKRAAPSQSCCGAKHSWAWTLKTQAPWAANTAGAVPRVEPTYVCRHRLSRLSRRPAALFITVQGCRASGL